MTKATKELLLVVISLIPLGYLLMIYDSLPHTVPIHFNLEGQPNGWASRGMLFAIPGLLGPGVYLLMRAIPHIDTKQMIRQMGEKYFIIRLVTGLFISCLSVYILYITSAGSIAGPKYMFMILGLFFALFGNYMQTVRPNYFVGIRTPWTLENTDVWKATHRLGGRIWMVGGVLIVLTSLLFKSNATSTVIFIVLIGIMVLVPVIHSYVIFKKVSHNANP